MYTIILAPIEGNSKLSSRFGLSSTGNSGTVCEEKRFIVADPTSDVLSTIVHEVLHVLYDEDEEKLIVKREELIMKHLTRQQAEKLWVYACICMAIDYEEISG